MRAIQRLMGALCFARRAAAGRPNPYSDLMAEDVWGNLGELCRACWGTGPAANLMVVCLSGHLSACGNHLSMCLAANMFGLPAGGPTSNAELMPPSAFCLAARCFMP